MSGCITGKNGYPTRELAEEALIQNRARYYHRTDGGPINVYRCDDCNEWHFTSKGEINPLLLDPEIQKKIQLAREAGYWENKLK